MKETRSLIRDAVTQDLLGPDVLLGPDDDPVAPPGYELVRELGRGGAGAVYLGHDLTLDRDVAIKFLRDATPGDVERFRREARFTARLERAAIVQVYELGESDGSPYIAMQYLDGGNLAQAELDHAGVARVVREVAAALGHAHRAGIVHRDVKPENILLDGEGHAYIADFGIARDLRGGLGETISTAGQIIGTPALMPPEQARGDIEAIDARSDVYAIGATLFVKLAGRYPFEGTSLVDVLHAVIHDPPPMPRAIDATIPRELETIVVRCMRKARDDRYATMDDIVVALDAYLAGATEARPSTSWFRRLVDQRPDAPETPTTVDDLQADPFWVKGIEIVREIARWDADLYRVSGSLERSFDRLIALETQLDTLLETRPDMAWARFYRGVVRFRRGRLREALEDMEKSIDRMRDLAGASFELGRLYLALYLSEHHEAHKHIHHAGVEMGLGEARCRLQQAALAFREAQRCDGELSAEHRDYADAVARLAEGDFEGCVDACDAMIERDPDVEAVWKLRGDAQRLAGALPFESYDRAIEVRRSYYEAHFAKAEAHLAREELEEARAALTRACTIHPEYVEAFALLARLSLEETRRDGEGGILDEAIGVAERAVELDGTSYDAVVTLAEIHLERGRRDKDAAWFDAADAALRRARDLPGCQNRVNFLVGHANLERARQVRAAGGDPAPHADVVRDLCHRTLALDEVDDEMWNSLQDTVRSEFGG
jgi:serine/threonine protein kinase